MNSLNDEDFSFYSLDDDDDEWSSDEEKGNASRTDLSSEALEWPPSMRGMGRPPYIIVLDTSWPSMRSPAGTIITPPSSCGSSDDELSDMEVEPTPTSTHGVLPLLSEHASVLRKTAAKPKTEASITYSLGIVTDRLFVYPGSFGEINAIDIGFLETAIDALYGTFYTAFENSNQTLPSPRDAVRIGYVLSVFEHLNVDTYMTHVKQFDIGLVLRCFLLADFMRGLRCLESRLRTPLTTHDLLHYITFFEPDARVNLLREFLYPENTSIGDSYRVRCMFYAIARNAWIKSVFARVSPNTQPSTYLIHWLLSPESPLSRTDIFGRTGEPKKWEIPKNLDQEATRIVKAQSATIEQTLKRASKINFNGIPRESTCLSIIDKANMQIMQHCPDGAYTPAVMVWAKNSIAAIEASKTIQDLEAVLINAPYSTEINYYIRDRYDRKLFKVVHGAILRRFDQFAALPFLYGDI